MRDERAIIVGFGEVGRAHWENLRRAYSNLLYKDKADDLFDVKSMVAHLNGRPVDYLLVATQCNPANMGPFYDMVVSYAAQFKPRVIDILTTTPCGSVDELQEMIADIPVCKSSTRGMHPHLAKFLLDIPKHIGGPMKAAEELAGFYKAAGWECVLHAKGRTVELCHVLNNFLYGVNIMATNEAAAIARENGVDWHEILKYRETNNIGFTRAGYPSKVSPLLYPSGGKIGGHCVVYSATTIPEDKRGPLAKLLASYNDPK